MRLDIAPESDPVCLMRRAMLRIEIVPEPSCFHLMAVRTRHVSESSSRIVTTGNEGDVRSVHRCIASTVSVRRARYQAKRTNQITLGANPAKKGISLYVAAVPSNYCLIHLVTILAPLMKRTPRRDAKSSVPISEEAKGDKKVADMPHSGFWDGTNETCDAGMGVTFQK